MMRTIFFTLALALAFPATVHAEVSAADQKAIDAKVEVFFNGLNAGKAEEVTTATFLPRVSDKKLEIQNLIGQTNMAIAYLGAPVKWALMDKSESADLLVYRKYLVYSKDMPMKFVFVFFKTDKGWFAQTINFSDVSAADLGG